LIAAGFGRAWLELFFRPDQPKIPGTIISYSGIFAGLMGIVGVIMLMARYKKISLPVAENWEEEYQISTQPKLQAEPEELVEAQKTPRVKKVSRVTTKAVAGKKASANKTTAKSPTPKKKPTTRTKKSSQ